MFGIGLPELLIILVIAIVVIGPDKLPDLARAVGKGIGEFRRATDELKNSFDADDDLREIKTQLTQARDDMTSMVREHTKGMNVDGLAKSLEEGTFFEKKDGKTAETASEPSSEPGDESDATEKADVTDKVEATDQVEATDETGETGGLTPDQASELPENGHPPKSDA